MAPRSKAGVGFPLPSLAAEASGFSLDGASDANLGSLRRPGAAGARDAGKEKWKDPEKKKIAVSPFRKDRSLGPGFVASFPPEHQQVWGRNLESHPFCSVCVCVFLGAGLHSTPQKETWNIPSSNFYIGCNFQLGSEKLLGCPHRTSALSGTQCRFYVRARPPEARHTWPMPIQNPGFRSHCRGSKGQVLAETQEQQQQKKHIAALSSSKFKTNCITLVRCPPKKNICHHQLRSSPWNLHQGTFFLGHPLSCSHLVRGLIPHSVQPSPRARVLAWIARRVAALEATNTRPVVQS